MAEYKIPPFSATDEEEIKKIVKETNEILKDFDDSFFDDEENPSFIEICGILYIPTEILVGVVENHQDSIAVATFQMMQCPSADDNYEFEVSEKFLKKYYKKIKYACDKIQQSLGEENG